MVSILEFFLLVVVVSASGVLAPGPLFIANVSQGIRCGYKGGIMCSLGHMLVELPLVLLITTGMVLLLSDTSMLAWLGILGGIAMVAFGLTQAFMTIDVSSLQATNQGKLFGPLATGIIFTALNPLFIVWWITVGMGGLIAPALRTWAIVGVLVMYGFHVWMDYAWLTFTAHVSKKAISMVGSRGFRIIFIVLSMGMVYFGVKTLLESIGHLGST